MQQDDLLALIRSLMELTQKVSQGQYGFAEELLDFTKSGKYPELISELAESFSMMMVKVEAREFKLEQMIDELAAKNRELEATLSRVHLLENIKKQLDKFVPTSVRTLIEDNPDCPDLEKRDEDVTVLFLDVAGYTRLSEQVAQEQVNYLIQTYFSSFLDIILENRGDINETAGDGLMIIFRDSAPEVHARSAVRAAIEIRNKTAVINEVHRSLYEPVTVNMGINSGLASVGMTQFEGIAGTRCTFTASGPVTNMAARICPLATGGAILLGTGTYRRVKEVFAVEAAGEYLLKNIQKPVPVFRVV